MGNMVEELYINCFLQRSSSSHLPPCHSNIFNQEQLRREREERRERRLQERVVV